MKAIQFLPCVNDVIGTPGVAVVSSDPYCGGDVTV